MTVIVMATVTEVVVRLMTLVLQDRSIGTNGDDIAMQISLGRNARQRPILSVRLARHISSNLHLPLMSIGYIRDDACMRLPKHDDMEQLSTQKGPVFVP